LHTVVVSNVSPSEAKHMHSKTTLPAPPSSLPSLLSGEPLTAAERATEHDDAGLPLPSLTEREVIAEKANAIAIRSRYGRTAPVLDAEATRDRLVRWLAWNDPNGSHHDDEAEADGCDVYTLATAWEQISSIVAEDES
jgi:hypothetical protein